MLWTRMPNFVLRSGMKTFLIRFILWILGRSFSCNFWAKRNQLFLLTNIRSLSFLSAKLAWLGILQWKQASKVFPYILQYTYHEVLKSPAVTVSRFTATTFGSGFTNRIFFGFNKRNKLESSWLSWFWSIITETSAFVLRRTADIVIFGYEWRF